MSDFWAKAVVSARSAHLLYNSADADGAANRAYYAMYDAARASSSSSKSHGTVIRRFGKHVVVGYGLHPNLGRALNLGEDIRLVADYARRSVDPFEATSQIKSMDQLPAAVARIISETYP
jgi:uncharacterized protein (UPF0332 family)